MTQTLLFMFNHGIAVCRSCVPLLLWRPLGADWVPTAGVDVTNRRSPMSLSSCKIAFRSSSKTGAWAVTSAVGDFAAVVYGIPSPIASWRPEDAVEEFRFIYEKVVRHLQVNIEHLSPSSSSMFRVHSPWWCAEEICHPPSSIRC